MPSLMDALLSHTRKVTPAPDSMETLVAQIRHDGLPYPVEDFMFEINSLSDQADETDDDDERRSIQQELQILAALMLLESLVLARELLEGDADRVIDVCKNLLGDSVNHEWNWDFG